MRLPHGFLRSWLALASSDLAGQALSLLAVPRVARRLEPEGYGLYATALSNAALFGLLAGAGLSSVIVTHAAKHGAVRRLIGPVVGIRTVSVSVAAVLALGFNLLTGAVLNPGLMALTVTLIGTSAVLDVLESIAFGRRIFRISSTLNLANSLLWVALLYAIPAHLLDAQGILGLYVGLQIAQTVAYALLLTRSGESGTAAVSESHVGVWSLLRRGLPFLWVNLTGIALVQAPVLLLAVGAGTKQVGLYSAAYRLALPVTLLLGALARAALPHLVVTYREQPAHFRRLVDRTAGLMSAGASAAAVALTGVATEVCALLLGPAYHDAARILGLLASAMSCLAVLSLLGLAVSAMEQQHRLVVLSTAAVGMAFPLIVVGAWQSASVLATLVAVAYLFSLVLHTLVLSRPLGLRDRGWRLLPGGLIAFTVAAVLPHDAGPLLRWPLAGAIAVALLCTRGGELASMPRPRAEHAD